MSEPITRMTARSVVLSVLLGAHPAWASAGELVRLTSDFDIREPTLRVALTRMVGAGDLVRSGPFGLMSFQGRTKNVIKSGGYSVYAIEVEADLAEHPDVVEAGVVGLDDPKLGQVPVAAVRLRDGASVSPDELLSWARDRMARYKAPRQVVFVDDLPRTGTRKVRRDSIVPLFEDPAAGQYPVSAWTGSDRRIGDQRAGRGRGADRRRRR